MVTRFRIYFIACTNVPSFIRGTLYKLATFNDINVHYRNGCCASVITINYVHAFKRRRRKSSSPYNDIQFLRCNCNSWFNCMDLLLNVMYMKRLLRFLSSLFYPALTSSKIPLIKVSLYPLPYYIHITELTTES